MIPPPTIYTQILRRNCENKDKIDQLIGNLNLKNNIQATNGESVEQFDGKEHYDEGKLLKNIINFDKKFYSKRSNWIKFRNECFNHLCMKGGSKRFSQEFVKILNTYDYKFVKDNEKLISFLTCHLYHWRSKKQNLDLFIESLCDLYKHYYSSQMSQQIYFTTKTILREILATYGSSAVVKIAESFKCVCVETNDYELLFILWRELFESEWFSDQKFSHQLIEMPEVRKILAIRTRNLCYEYFNDNDTDLANRLIQIFLKYNMIEQCTLTLKFYLAYECFQSNVSAATQVVKLCIELNIPLSESENRKYLDLLLKRSVKQQHHRQQQQNQSQDDSNKISVEKYKFKF
ncbi:hypothetical protein PVAND_003826 [Polypedilum vanderplanki]|uniref:Uncharacterized protein n=1 Tax=Polypedilum vanderplanki TaxID=319348 RepID=A0A9J6BVQ9_POLVA|nr:hypothetical protein PVAND_003826 [Polypedilum vanderplanki]